MAQGLRLANVRVIPAIPFTVLFQIVCYLQKYYGLFCFELILIPPLPRFVVDLIPNGDVATSTRALSVGKRFDSARDQVSSRMRLWKSGAWDTPAIV